MHKSSISSVEIATGMFLHLFSSLLLPTFFYIFLSLYFTLFWCISCPSTFLSYALLPCPSIICSYPFIVPTCHVQNLNDRIFGMHDLGHHGGHNLYVNIEKIYTHTKAFPFVFVPFPFHFCSHSFHVFLFSCQFPFTSFHVPSISVNHIFILRSSYLISLLSFCSFMSFWCSSDFPFRSSHFPSHLPFMSLSFTLLSLQFPSLYPSSHSVFLVCPVILDKKNRISAHVRFKLCSWSLVLFMIFHARLCFFSVLYFFQRSIFTWTTVSGNFWIFYLWDLMQKKNRVW